MFFQGKWLDLEIDVKILSGIIWIDTFQSKCLLVIMHYFLGLISELC